MTKDAGLSMKNAVLPYTLLSEKTQRGTYSRVRKLIQVSSPLLHGIKVWLLRSHPHFNVMRIGQAEALPFH
jgi:hypothetical protein